MEAKKNPKYLRAMVEAVKEFKAALEHFLTFHVVNGEEGLGVARGIAPAVFRKEDAAPEEISQAHSAVAAAAGRAAEAPGLTNMYFGIAGIPQPVDPVSSWGTIAQPKPLLEPINILDACDQMIGRLEGLALKAEAEMPPEIGVKSMHPLVWAAAAKLWRDNHFKQAVAAAAESLVTHVKGRTSRFDVSGTRIWQVVYSDMDPQPGEPRLRWPGDPKNEDVKTMNNGLRSFGSGVQSTIRNPSSHGVSELSEQEGLERLAVLSLLARWVDECELQEAQ